jgi:hypothetical protein
VYVPRGLGDGTCLPYALQDCGSGDGVIDHPARQIESQTLSYQRLSVSMLGSSFGDSLDRQESGDNLPNDFPR